MCSRKLAEVTIVGEIVGALRVSRTRFMLTQTCLLGWKTCRTQRLCTKLRAAEARRTPRVRPIKPRRTRGLTLIASGSLLLVSAVATYTVCASGHTLRLNVPSAVAVTVRTVLTGLPAWAVAVIVTFSPGLPFATVPLSSTEPP
jgi:hypothetical protein